MSWRPRILIPDAMGKTYEGSSRAAAVLEGAASTFDPWASFFEDETPWGQRFPGPGNRMVFYVRNLTTLRRALEEAQRDQPRLFDPDSIEHS